MVDTLGSWDEDRALLGEALSRSRLALVALALADTNGVEYAMEEATAILAGLNGLLVEAGAIDPLEASGG